MDSSSARIAVTPPVFCQTRKLKKELLARFPHAYFNPDNTYLDEQQLIAFAREADGLLVGRDPVNPGVLKHLSQLKIVAKYGVGLDNIDEKALKANGVALGWSPGVNKTSVAELTLGFMIGLIHNTFRTGFSLKQGQWIKDGGRLLSGKTIGIVGCGYIGQELVRLLQPFACSILVCDILDMTYYCKENGLRQVNLENLLQSADMVSLHVPLTPLTRNMMNRETLSRMKPDAFLINTSRGAVVETSAIKSALTEDWIAGAALDVFSVEPPEDREFLALPNLMPTPHIGGNSLEAVDAMGRSAIWHLTEFFNGLQKSSRVLPVEPV